MDLWGFIAWFFWVFVFVAYLMVLFSIIGDIFRDHSLNGWLKAIWILFLIFVPFLTALIYLIARGPAMQKRAIEQATELRAQQDEYIRATAGSGSSSAADDIAKAKALLDSGAVTQAEFEALKSKALAS
ncbi:PLDc N-terminal domain-containing protein [Microbacterium sp. CFBP9034]|uniref:PLDc N-terminal domain-containing protein n=1 Tax=Microbacterium sp. CFBP9034 TaxID=3096540 RepID=UPI002A698B1C|nr:PLDc N-terminal domain-containing protein [Microbacterium sp. CFBP9034]MDY0908246.1 PLDc N-terminal domain-containing protein [Microbacterium sp. CFBP9034]